MWSCKHIWWHKKTEFTDTLNIIATLISKSFVKWKKKVWWVYQKSVLFVILLNAYSKELHLQYKPASSSHRVNHINNTIITEMYVCLFVAYLIAWVDYNLPLLWSQCNQVIIATATDPFELITRNLTFANYWIKVVPHFNNDPKACYV